MNSDFLIKGDRFPKPGETIKGSAFLSAGGGKGANQAVAAARLGARAVLISCVGRDTRGRELLRMVKLDKVDTSHVCWTDNAETGAALVMIDDSGEKEIVATPGANACISTLQIDRAAGLFGRAKVLLLQFEAPVEVVIEAAARARAAGMRVVLDPAPPLDLPKRLLPLINAIRPNSHEAEVLTGIRISDRESALRAARKLQEQGIRIVATQAGDEGDVLLWEDQTIWLPKMDVESVDATGAGDAFAAALAVALVEEMDPETAGRFCSAAAALTTTKLGAQPALPFRREVEALMRKARRRQAVRPAL